MSPWSNAAPTLRCGIRTVGTGVSPARYAHRCRGGRPRSRARPHIPSRIAPSGSIPVAREPRRHAQLCTTSTSSPSPGYCHATSSYSAGWAFQYHAGTDLTILFQHDHLPLRARRASVQRLSGIRPIPNGNRLHAPARKSAGPRRSRRSPRYPQMLPVVSCYFFLFEPR